MLRSVRDAEDAGLRIFETASRARLWIAREWTGLGEGMRSLLPFLYRLQRSLRVRGLVRPDDHLDGQAQRRVDGLRPREVAGVADVQELVHRLRHEAKVI